MNDAKGMLTPMVVVLKLSKIGPDYIQTKPYSIQAVDGALQYATVTNLQGLK